jgi:predicted flap endonuclease-1-like 5' DNA nuclease
MSAKRFLQKIKQVFGLTGGGDTDTDRPGERRTDVTVERETDTHTRTAETVTEETDEPTTESGPDTTEETDKDATESGPDTTAAEESADETPDDATASEPVEKIKGIGPTYSDRLSAAGIETVAQLADADPATVADAAQTGTTKASDWIDRAQARQ